jgi:ABC-2 type transport system permease protein
MNKTFLIFKHEFIGMLTRKGFIIMTLIVPLVFLLGIIGYRIISGAVGPSETVTQLGYIDNAGGFTQYNTQGSIYLKQYNTVEDATHSLVTGDITQYFVIDTSYYSTGIINFYTLEKQLAPPPEIITAIKQFMTNNMLAGKLPQSQIELINSSLNMASTRLTETGTVSSEQGGLGDLILPLIFAVLLYISIVISSSNLVQGLGDEKENRLIEVLLSSVSTRQLITGKVLGLGAAGLVSVVVWVICAPFLINFASASIGGILSTLTLSPAFFVICIVYFILGYLLFAVISTCVGAITPSAREGQQLAVIFTLTAAVPLWFSSIIVMYPNSPVCIFLSIFPLTAPVTIISRLGSTDVPIWQILLSVAVLLISIAIGLFLAIKIVRTFLLMYGKRPNLGTIIRSLRNS